MPTDSTPGTSERNAGPANLEAELTRSRERLRAARKEIARLVTVNGRLQEKLNEMAEREAEIRQLAYRDPLTGLPNRTLLMDRLNQELARAQRHSDTEVGLLFIDLDGFKQVNDRFGHALGDALLRRVAKRLLECTRSADTVCRYGGDEFLVILPDLEEPNAMQRAADKIRRRLAEPFWLQGHQITLSACVGSGLYPTEAADHTTLIQFADAAMYQDKRSARDI